MCGISGVFRFDEQPVTSQQLAQMSAAMAHRGPDGTGTWSAENIGLAHRRLAIIDLSPNGHQPMADATGNYILTYNGMIYNYQELRYELEQKGHQFHSNTDTEIILHAYREWGAACLLRFNGMFAFGLWDQHKRELFIARDRFGIKPLYYYADSAKFLFASEIKSILTQNDVRRTVSYAALNEYFTFQNILTDQTLFNNIYLLQAGHYLILSATKNKPQPQRYWDYSFQDVENKLSFQEAAEEVGRLFQQAVTRQLASDVPLACYLSGGIDSGAITAMARRHLGRLKTFTAGFDLSSVSGLEIGFDERARAEFLSNILKTEHYEMVLHAGDMEHVLPELIWHLEDLRVGQCYPNYYIARLASKFAKVVLSGAGGDELFGGYPWRYYRGLGEGDYYKNYYSFWQRLVPDEEKKALFVPDVVRQLNGHSTYDVFCDVFRQAELPLGTDSERVNASLYFELKTFLPGLLLVEDKISMAHALETRVPFLDNDLVDFAMRLPVEFKLQNIGQLSRTLDENAPGKKIQYEQQRQDGKLILRKAMEHVMPAVVTERAKQGFSAPDATWFRGESIDYIQQLLDKPHARLYEYLSPVWVQGKLAEHTHGKHNNRLLIWSFLSFEWWLRKFM